MISNGIEVIPLIIELWDAHTRITQPCYADDVGSGGSFGDILSQIYYLQGRGLLWVYFLDPTKSISVVTLWSNN